jgi:DNA-binding beta-propeller fold protein YncE
MNYAPVDRWEQLPAGYHHRDVAGVAVDAQDRVYLITRGDSRVIVYEPGGAFIRSWGEDRFTPRTHGITIGPDGAVYCTDDADQTVRKFTPEGELLLTLGTSGIASDTGYDGKDLASITHGGPPFNRPTNVAIGPNGDLYVTDGYGNARVHRFSADGALLHSWGAPGTGPGQFNLPHGIAALADGRLLVADRENDRIQVFTLDGRYLEEWTSVQRPTQIVQGGDGRIYVAELWWRPGQRSYVHGPIADEQYGRISILDLDGQPVARIGGGPPNTPGSFCAPHGLAVDSTGAIYVAEVTDTFGRSPAYANTGPAVDLPPETPTLQKLAPR